ncbi:SMP-30/gluconolactonase/LRE family protein [Phytomonospora endophytica]|uniref:Cu-Zn family superoxide dismutase n=2 Tax=Phytomonospora endophytica TaxID=714109 RepID=A0A841FHA3_9ACTN|nr:hypothetical protein [Phytomonospora endophytica]MBB6034363.1 Cu-Zn family superoxide dismutase [Phytomonospora endophytica]
MIERYELPGGDVFPEGITEGPDGKTFYVSGSADGAVYRGHLDRPELELWSPPGADGRHGALGMTVDGAGRLIVCGGHSGVLFAYDTATGALVARHQVTTKRTLLNDVCVNGGHAYATDSLRPAVWRFALDTEIGAAEPWIDLTGHGIEPGKAAYLNGLVSTQDGSALLIAAQGTGQLWHVDIATREAAPVDLGGVEVRGDGMVFAGDVLYVCDYTGDAGGEAHFRLTALRLTDGHRKAEVLGHHAMDAADTPTTVAYLGGRLLVVNSQLAASDGPKAPFTVTALEPPF